jgi:hypothetical protein
VGPLFEVRTPGGVVVDGVGDGVESSQGVVLNASFIHEGEAPADDGSGVAGVVQSATRHGVVDEHLGVIAVGRCVDQVCGS